MNKEAEGSEASYVIISDINSEEGGFSVKSETTESKDIGRQPQSKSSFAIVSSGREVESIEQAYDDSDTS